MPVDLGKVEREAPHLVDLVKKTGVVLSKKGIDPSKYQAAVLVTLDHSGSTEQGRNRLYSDGTMQNVTDMAFAASLLFDDDGTIPISYFHNYVDGEGDVTLGNCRGYVDQSHRRVEFGGTEYAKALRWIIDQAGFGGVDLRSGGGLFHKGGLQAKARAPYPTFAIFVTDGEPQDAHRATELLVAMSQLPIFVQFVGVGEHRFQYLHELDEMEGRFIDNAGFFDAKHVSGQDAMLEALLGEFPSYYVNARKAGLIA